MAELIAARDWLTIYRLPPYAHELNPVEQVWSHLKRSLANLAKRNLTQLSILIKTRLRRMQYRPGCSTASSPAPGLTSAPSVTPTIKDRRSLTAGVERSVGGWHRRDDGQEWEAGWVVPSAVRGLQDGALD